MNRDEQQNPSSHISNPSLLPYDQSNPHLNRSITPPPSSDTSTNQLTTSTSTPSPTSHPLQDPLISTLTDQAHSPPLTTAAPTTPQRQSSHDSGVTHTYSPTHITTNGDSPASVSPSSSTSSSPSGSGRVAPNRRVKLYRLKEDSWLDLGTGNCIGLFIEPSNSTSQADEGPWIVVSREGTNESGKPAEVLLKARVQMTGYGSDDEDDDEQGILLEGDEPRVVDSGRYQRQQDTLIVWTDRETKFEMALSFATTVGCAEIWDFITQARKWHESEQMHGSPSIGSSMSPPQPFPQQYGPMTPRLPEVSLNTIGQLEAEIRLLGRTASGREATVRAILAGEMIQKLIRIQEEAEDLESLEDLHVLCRVMQTILLLNDNAIFEMVLRDEIILGVASILEYDPEFPTMKASYRAYLADPSHFTQVVPIRSPTLLARIHQTHRLYYLKDVVLARILEESTFSMLGSAIYFNEVDIVNEIVADAELIRELFAIFDQGLSEKEGDDGGEQIGPQLPPALEAKRQLELSARRQPDLLANGDHLSITQRQHDAILFLEQFCSMAKNLQLPLRAAFFRNLVSKGLLQVIEMAMVKTMPEGDSLLRSAAIGILMGLVDHDPNNVRAYSLLQHSAAKRPLVLFLIELFQKESDSGLKTQMAEALRVLVDAGGEGGPLEVPPRMRQEDPDAEKFLQYFYDHCVIVLLNPILQLPDIASDARLNLPSDDVALCSHLCDLLCFFITHHTFRSKYFVLSSSISMNVAKLLRTRHKPLRLAALRYFRSCIGKNDDFFNRFLIKNDLFRPILDMALEEQGKDNLLASACLEFFEFIRLTNIKAILNHLMTTYGDRIRTLATGLKSLAGLIQKWEQNNEPPPAVELSLTATSKSMTREKTSWSQMMDADAESTYFNGSDDEDDISGSTSLGRKRENDDNGARKKARLSASSMLLGGSLHRGQVWSSHTQSKGKAQGLVDYGDDDEEDDIPAGGFIRATKEEEQDDKNRIRDDDEEKPQLPSVFESSSSPAPAPDEPDTKPIVSDSTTPFTAIPVPIPLLEDKDASLRNSIPAGPPPEFTLGSLRRQREAEEEEDESKFSLLNSRAKLKKPMPVKPVMKLGMSFGSNWTSIGSETEVTMKKEEEESVEKA